ncbi:hypothetical protein SS1G_09353 [Sclerotinia sclerotiorum 1980 UF-70]|uniref:Uncharacterized protein n=1 Tax=Sclerotinia sclerotiorum (strain ATCC 18683 / 1980 / Ss-1) TaxID=665079 RepID=A7EVJ4_SCLS1|nr:hypothetical protein SS1G_09353 [Sclerotinia sclerotiorum 1980 UF-70]EDN93486.1 hypothetical protein SS1G_09353 [Sclerotinia sclerotiorum 1980 UF-70]
MNTWATTTTSTLPGSQYTSLDWSSCDYSKSFACRICFSCWPAMDLQLISNLWTFSCVSIVALTHYITILFAKIDV